MTRPPHSPPPLCPDPALNIAQCDAVGRFARQCQLAAAVFLPPSDCVQILTTAWACLRSCRICCELGAIRNVPWQPVATLAWRVHEYDSVPQAWSDRCKRQAALRRLAIRALSALLDGYMRESLTLSSIAASLNVSTSHLCRTIHLISGTKFTGHLSGLRLLAAMPRLAHTNIAIGIIAVQCGYHHTGELDRDFRRWVHISATQFRQEFRAIVFSSGAMPPAKTDH
jgi:AraC-like DNA-binding protein